jgi:thiamine kinase
VYDLGDGRVVKLLLPGFDSGMLDAEGLKTQAAHDAGLPAPATHGSMAIGDRVGHVFDRVDGRLMVDEITARPVGYRRQAGVLAGAHAALHAGSTSRLPPIKEKLAAQIDEAAPLDERLRRVAKDRLLSLADGDQILHGDFHPGNVVLTSDGPVVIDWLDASRGDPAADIARTSWLLSGAAIEPGTPRRGLLTTFVGLFRRRYLRVYHRTTGLDRASVARWRLPVLAARLSEGVEHETERLVAEVRSLAAG